MTLRDSLTQKPAQKKTNSQGTATCFVAVAAVVVVAVAVSVAAAVVLRSQRVNHYVEYTVFPDIYVKSFEVF